MLLQYRVSQCTHQASDHLAQVCILNLVVTCPGGQILATDAIREAYHEGRGSIPIRGRAIIEGDMADNGNGSNGGKVGKSGKGKTQRKRSGEGKPAVVITELPYQTNKVYPDDWTS